MRSFKGQLGPGPYTPRLFSRYIAQLATDRPAGGAAIRAVRLAQRAFGVPDAAVPAAFEAAAEEHLADRPSVLGKLVFIAERAVGNPASVASLRGRLPYGAEYVDSLQVCARLCARGGAAVLGERVERACGPCGPCGTRVRACARVLGVCVRVCTRARPQPRPRAR